MIQPGLPLVSVITPSYKHAKFIKETIDSVLNQDYPNVEMIVVDGGSTDGTLSILKQYSQLGNCFRFVSEPDRGQSHAINKGLAMARGEIIGWLNSDDTYHPGAIRKAVQTLQQRPDCGMMHGKCHVINEHSQVQSALQVSAADYNKLYHGCVICQPAAFIRKDVFQQMGGVDESLQFCMDYDLWIRIAKHYTIAYIDDFLANARVHSASKTSTQWNTVGIHEVIKTVEKHYGSISETWLRYAPQYRKSAPPSFGQGGQIARLHQRPILQPISQQTQSTPQSQPQSHPVLPPTFGHPERIISMNRYSDLWVPPLFRIAVQIYPSMHTLRIRGRAPSPQPGQSANFSCNVLVNGRQVGQYQVVSPSFTWSIPLDETLATNQIDILSTKMKTEPGSNRTISFIADEVLPLTGDEAAFLKRSDQFFQGR